MASSVVAVLAQRLARVICSTCRKPYQPTDEELDRLGLGVQKTRPTFYRGAGCQVCGTTGYRGRTGIYELMVMDDQVRMLIGAKAEASKIREVAISKGMVPLKLDGANKVLKGITTTEEIMRIAQQDVEL